MSDLARYPKQSLLAELKSMAELAAKGNLTLGDLAKDMGPRGHAVLAVILCLPFIIPMPLPGVSTPFGIVIIFIGLAILLNRDPWLPRQAKSLVIPKDTFVRAVQKAEPHLKRLEKIFRPRLLMLSATVIGVRLHGLMIMFCAALLALPAPPGGNAAPGSAIILYSLAIIEEDGLMTLLALVATVITVVFFGGIFALAYYTVLGWVDGA